MNNWFRHHWMTDAQVSPLDVDDDGQLPAFDADLLPLPTPLRSGAQLAVTGIIAPTGTAVIDGPFVSLGPSPESGPSENAQSADSPPNGTNNGAIEAIAIDPADNNTIWIGAPNGGIWVTHDGGKTWTPLTDNLASLSIASLSLDPTDPTNQTLIAGIGLTSSGTLGSISTSQSFFTGNGGQRTGILYSTDGGATWSALGGTTLAGHSITNVIARGSILLAASYEPWGIYSGLTAEANNGGLFRSTDGGATFAQVTNGLPADPVSSLVGDPSNNSRLFAAVTDATHPLTTGVYISTDTGASWTQIFGAAQSGGLIAAGGDQTFAKLAAGINGELAVALIDVQTQSLVGLFLSTNAGTSWAALPLPPADGFSDAVNHFAIAVDPTTPGVVYVTGASVSTDPYFMPTFRITTSTVTSISGANTANDSSVHADSRAITFDSSGNLILAGDGGLYERTNPLSATGTWSGMNGGGLSVGAPYAIAFDGNSDRVIISSQDSGSAIETAPGSAAYTALFGGDGINADVNDTTLPGDSVIYVSSQNLFLHRDVIDAQGNPVGPTPELYVYLQDTSGYAISTAYGSPFVLNTIDPTLIAVGGMTDLYVTQDATLGNVNAAMSSLTFTATDLGQIGQVTAISYGTEDDTNAILAGAAFGTNNLWLTADATDPTATTPITAYAGLAPTSVTFDTRTMADFYVADGNDLYGSQDGGNTIQTLTGSLTALGVIRPTSLAFIANNGVDALLVGGLDSLANAASPLVVADSNSNGNLSGWRMFGTGLPNTTVSTLSYDAKSDTLAAGLFGRGAWVLYDVTSNFAAATVLQFGLANNNSSPDASLLTGNRPLEKFGTGRLTISGTSSFTGGTTLEGGTIEIAVGGSLGSSAAITFAAPRSTLQLDAALAAGATYATPLTNFTMEGTIDLAALPFHTGASAHISGATITVNDGGTLEHFLLSSPAAAPLYVFSDGATGIDVSSVACYLRGTHIATPAGEAAIETLRAGDTVLTAGGTARPIRWIGRRSFDGQTLAAHPSVRPICIRADALADRMPSRDLYVSPNHALYLDNILIPAGCLVNGTTITRDTDRTRIDYVHLELDTHDVIIAEGVPAESYLDEANRGMFHNAGDAPLDPPLAQSCAERHEVGPRVAAVRDRLALRAVAGPPDSCTHRVMLAVTGVTRAILPPGVTALYLHSEHGYIAGDRRPLGALITDVAVDGVAIDLADLCLSRGFHRVEHHNGTPVRWTNGEAVLAFGAVDRPRLVDVIVAALPSARRAL